MSKFASLGLSKQLADTLEKSGYSDPTPIQEKTIPELLKGRDVVGIAQTGTGKTAAFVLPILEKLIQAKTPVEPKRCTALIVVPTRELASQIDDNIAKYGEKIYHQRASIVGGMKYPPQVKKLFRGLDIMVATPGRLEDHLKQGNISLQDTKIVVLDEADQMMDLGFFPAIRRIMRKAPQDRQTVLLSATMPKEIRKLANEFLTDPVDVQVAKQGTPIEKIEQMVYLMDRASKRPFLLAQLENEFRTIVFTRTKHGANDLVTFLKKKGVLASAIHGNKSQAQRQRALDLFRSGKEHILVATDVAARGIDIPDVSLVVNYDPPMQPESYVHRIGRTARAGREGRAITLCAPDEKKRMRDVERLTKLSLPTQNVTVAMREMKAPDASKDTDAPTQDGVEVQATKTLSDFEDGSMPPRPKRKQGKKPRNRDKGNWDGKPQGKRDGKSGGKTGGFKGKAGGKPGGKPGGFKGKPGGKPSGKPGGKKPGHRGSRPTGSGGKPQGKRAD